MWRENDFHFKHIIIYPKNNYWNYLRREYGLIKHKCKEGYHFLNKLFDGSHFCTTAGLHGSSSSLDPAGVVLEIAHSVLWSVDRSVFWCSYFHPPRGLQLHCHLTVWDGGKSDLWEWVQVTWLLCLLRKKELKQIHILYYLPRDGQIWMNIYLISEWKITLKI